MNGEPEESASIRRSLRERRSEGTVRTDISLVPERLVESLPSFVHAAAIIDAQHRILGANEAYRDRFAGGDAVCGELCHSVVHRTGRPCHELGVACPMQDSVELRRSVRVIHEHPGADDGAAQEHVVESFPVVDYRTGKAHHFLEIIQPLHASSPGSRDGLELIADEKDPLHQTLGLIARVAANDTTVLLLGETGTGKEVAARAIHALSLRSQGPFVPVDCASMRETLFDSEMFGHEKGSFTGALQASHGLAEAAHGGTLFLDEVGDIPLPMQLKLLRLLERRTFRRVGSTEERKSDFRLICASLKDLPSMVREGGLRPDFYYRINAFPIRMPPLRDRALDMPFLVEILKNRIGCGTDCKLSSEALAALGRYSFPGNVRELLHVLERACVLASGGVIRPEHLPDEIRSAGAPPLDGRGFQGLLPLAEVEREYLRWARDHFDGERKELAQRLGLSERTLYRKLESLERA